MHQHIITTDASSQGWGAVLDNQSMGGQWTQAEACHHINFLELLATVLALKCFSRHVPKVHVCIRSDNTTTVAYLNLLGRMQSLQCDRLTKEIWLCCMQRALWVSASHVPGKSNVLADKASRQFHDNTEWILCQDLFLSITQLWGKPDVDLFASRLNAQLPCYVSWKPDPGASKSNQEVMNKTAGCIAWLQFLVNCVGDHQPDNGGIYLPTCFSKTDIYKKMRQENEALNQPTISLSHFYSLWDRHFSHVTIPKVHGLLLWC